MSILNLTDGIANFAAVTVQTYPSIEHGRLDTVRSIVLHRTDSFSAKSSLSAYQAGQKTGAHFLIDTDGCVMQTASLQKQCWHVGQLQSRCMNESSCSPSELSSINGMLQQKGQTWRQRYVAVSRFEAAKAYPARYPSNSDSIGIEVVGKFLNSVAGYQRPTDAQKKSLAWLVGALLSEYGLQLSRDVFAHGDIARKEKLEGSQLLQFLRAGVRQ
ncbi:N-acetylmuramoyl-L-alanine amidase [Pokkaliibacter plantistimulans]|uniref:N-acetylmuramoyl-L-alanine amidase n=1 Tax=Pokkaliibacter plantistimulans TaxID=1635171 RepID=A0ABX5M3E7_9GAMM|nr:peptidoglycan recognition family protein [Pokkaliibacter plantistimulans]PXF32106.1 N-acetylmuramoyl-L-alanine amidase [Pokkaliibacter plantistimulans]